MFNIFILNWVNRVKGIFIVLKGGVFGIVVDVKIVFVVVFKVMVCGIILVYNYFFGNRYFFEVDIKFISKLKEVGKVLDIIVIDYLILIIGNYYFFVDEGKI